MIDAIRRRWRALVGEYPAYTVVDSGPPSRSAADVLVNPLRLVLKWTPALDAGSVDEQGGSSMHWYYRYYDRSGFDVTIYECHD